MAAPATPNHDQTRIALEAILTSETFARSEQLRSFLRYVCEKTLDGHGRDINEYAVAVDALGRPADFSPAVDSSVRSRAYELRQKLQRYYESEQPDAPVRIELPKGSYTPRFVAWSGAEARPASAESPARDRLVRILAASLAASLLLVAALLTLIARGATPGHPAPAIQAAWGPLAEGGSEVLISVGTTLHMIVRPYMNIIAEGQTKYPAPPELYPYFRQHRPLPEGLELFMQPVDNSVQFGHTVSAINLATSLRSMGLSYQILPERSVPVAALRNRNAFIIGDPQNSNLAAQRLEKTPLTLEFDSTVEDLVIRERDGRKRKWVPRRGPDKRYAVAYGLISVLREPGDASGRRRVVVLSGITSVGTHGAAEFFCSAESLGRLLGRLRAEGQNGFPEFYQVVVRCGSNDTLLSSVDYEALRKVGD